MIDSHNGCRIGNGIIPGLGEIHHRCTWFWNFFTHLGENILQWPMRQIFFVYQRTTLSHTAWRERDAIGRRFLDPRRLKETYFWLGCMSRKNVLWWCVYSNSTWKSPHARKAACRLFSRGLIFTRARILLALLSLRKNGGLLVVYSNSSAKR